MKRFLTALLLGFLVIVAISAKPVYAADNTIYGDNCRTSIAPIVEVTMVGPCPPNAHIEAVSFTRENNSLVSTFEVEGRISVSDYAYVLFIYLSSGVQEYFQYSISLDSYYKNATFWDATTNSTKDIRYEVAGGMFRSWVPLSFLANKTHFWVSVETLRWSQSESKWYAVDGGGEYTFSWIYGEIRLPTQVTFNLQPSALANKVTLIVDGTQYRFGASCQLSLMMDSGSHKLSIDPWVQTANDTRFVVESWSDAQYGISVRTLDIDQDTSVTVSYTPYFLLTVSSDFGTVSGGDWWYHKGANASFSIKPTQLPYTGFLGVLNVQHQFSGWTGDVSSGDASSSVIMDKPKTVQANWTTSYGPLFFGFIGLIIGAPSIAVFLLYKLRRTRSSRK